MNANKQYIKKSTAAQELDVSNRTIDRLLERGELKKYKFGVEVRIDREEFDEYKKRHVISEAV